MERNVATGRGRNFPEIVFFAPLVFLGRSGSLRAYLYAPSSKATMW